MEWVNEWVNKAEYIRKQPRCLNEVQVSNFLANIYLFKVNNRNTRKRYEICSKLTIKILERRQLLLCDAKSRTKLK